MPSMFSAPSLLRSLLFAVACGALVSANFTASAATATNDSLRHFITRQGGKLFEGTNEFRFLGLAAPALHQNENQLASDYQNRFPDEFEIADTLESLRQLGARATRCFSLSIHSPSNNGAPVYIEGIGRYNETAFRSLDKVLHLCHKKGIRLILPVIASQSFWGWRGVDEFAAFRGQPGTNFWTAPQLRQDFKNLLRDLVNRTNTFTGIQYKNDPAILAWQAGNELTSYVWDRGLDARVWTPRITAWTIEMAGYLKTVDTNHLFMEGGGDREAFLAAPAVDIMSEHLYEYWARQSGQSYDLPRLAREAKAHAGDRKALIVDEFGLGEPLRLERLMDAIITSGISGGLLWSIRPHHRDGGFYYHNEGGTQTHSYHWPGFSVGEGHHEVRLLAALSRRAYQIRGLPLPPLPPPVGKPLLFPVGANGEMRWRGCTGASGYDIARAPSPAGPWTIIAEHVEDANVADVVSFENSRAALPPPLFRAEMPPAGQTHYYRVRGVNTSGGTAWSNVEMWSH